MQDLRSEVAKVARDFYLMSGMLAGHDLDNWLRAEELVLTWYEPEKEREKHVSAFSQIEHVIGPTYDEVFDPDHKQ